MKRLIFTVCTLLNTTLLFSQDWKDLPVPPDAGAGRMWQLQNSSDDFNYAAAADSKGNNFAAKWSDFYHSNWSGPGLTVWSRTQSAVVDGKLEIQAERSGTDKISTGCITSKERVIYPVYIEAKAEVMNSVLASNVWLLSPDDTQEIDILEAYGSSFSDKAQKDLSWYANRIHLSHHTFIRKPLQDYQPTDAGSWYNDGTLWRDNFHTFGVYWIDPWNLEYYIDGKLVRKVSGRDMIDPKGFTNGTGLSKEMDIIINVEDQTWRSNQNITPSDKELANEAHHTFNVDWIRIYKPVKLPVTTSGNG